MEANWKDKVTAILTEKYGELFADRVLKHLDYACLYTDYGAPGHMHLVLIKVLVEVLNKDGN